MTFGEKLQALRKHHDITQEALAEKLHTSHTSISRWEAGKALPDIQQVLILSELLNVSVDYLMYDRIDDTRQFRDFQSLRVLFWVCIAVNICGMVVSMIGWLWVRMAFPVVMGLVMNLLACVFFEVSPPKGIDRVMMRYARRQFYAASVWMLLPTPLYLTVNFIYSTEQYTTMTPYLIAGLVYILAGRG